MAIEGTPGEGEPLVDPRRNRLAVAKQIVVVEDDIESAELIVMVLKSEGYGVTWVSTGAEALETLLPSHRGVAPEERLHPDAILLDLTLADMDGTQVVRRLSEEGDDVPPVILSSARPRHSVEEIARSIGAACVLHKPYGIADLLASVEVALTKGAAH